MNNACDVYITYKQIEAVMNFSPFIVLKLFLYVGKFEPPFPSARLILNLENL